jgi:hypothetical protein
MFHGPNVPGLATRGGNSASFRNGGSVDVTLTCEELRPGATVVIEADHSALICTDPNLAQTRMTISATARGVDEVFKAEHMQRINAIRDLTASMTSVLSGDGLATKEVP